MRSASNVLRNAPVTNIAEKRKLYVLLMPLWLATPCLYEVVKNSSHTHICPQTMWNSSQASGLLAYSPLLTDSFRMNEAGVSVSLPFSTTTTSVPAASFPSAPLLVVGSSPSNSWFTSPWMSEGRRSPSLLETVNLWLMVVAGCDGSSCHVAGWHGRTKKDALAFVVPVVPW